MELATEQAAQAVEPPVVEPPPPVTEDVAEMQEEGKVPDVAKDAPQEAIPDSASQEAFEMNKGVHYIDDYREECERTGNMDKWQDKFASGHSDATEFVQPYEGRYANEWSLKKGQSASEGLENWMKGLTVADYRAVGVAKEVDEVRDEMGDQKFDKLFGSKNSDQDAAIPVEQRLKITSAAYTTPIDDQMREIGKKADAKQDNPAQNDPQAWQQFEREPKQDAQAAEKKDKGDQIVEQTPVTEEKQDKTLS